MIKIKDYPNYYQAADCASIKAQKNYLCLIQIDLVLMILASLLTIYNFQEENSRAIIYTISGLCLLFAIFISLIMKHKKFEDIWYKGRALAESCKTLTWRYMTGSELFEMDKSEQEVDKIFSDRIKEIYSEFKELNDFLDVKILCYPIITDGMKEVRKKSCNERKRDYIECRIKDQMTWYSKKAETNKSKYNYWFWVIIGSQILSLISIIFLIKYPMTDWNLVGLFTTFAASCFSWIQMKKYQENKEAYTIAATELNHIVQGANYINSEKELSQFVLDSENAVSREHTVWLAQKRK